MSIIFEPQKGKDLRVTYPELAKIDEFKKLSSQELLFAWCYASPSFDHYELNNRERITQSFEAAFGKDDRQLKQKYIAYNIPDRVKIAVERMRSFDVSARAKAKDMVKRIFDKFDHMINIDESKLSDENGKVDPSKYKSYVDICAKVSETLPKLLDQVESGFGVSEKEESEVFRPVRAIDRFHESNK